MKMYLIIFIITFLIVFGGIRISIGVEDQIEQAQEPETTYSIPNTFEGTATIVKPTGTECYEGLIRIDVDGEKIRVTVMDAVESDFADNF